MVRSDRQDRGVHGAMAAAHRMGMGNRGHGKVVGRHGRVGRARMGLLRLLVRVACARGRLLVGHARLGRLVRVVCIGRLRARLRSAPSALCRAALVRVVCEHGRGGSACIGRLRARLRSAPSALDCDCLSAFAPSVLDGDCRSFADIGGRYVRRYYYYLIIVRRYYYNFNNSSKRKE